MINHPSQHECTVSTGHFIYACLKNLIVGQQLLYTFWLHIKGQILKIHRAFWLHGFNVLVSAVELFMEQITVA